MSDHHCCTPHSNCHGHGHDHGCGHGHGEAPHACHCHDHDDELSPRTRIALIASAAVLLAVAAAVEHCCRLATWQLLLVYLVPYLLVGYGTLREAAEGIASGDVFNENFLMAVATVGALCIGFLPGAEAEFTEAVFVMLFFQVGELFEGYAEGKSRDSIAHLVSLRPDVAHVERGGAVVAVAPEEVAVGDVLVVSPGEKVAVDGEVIEGRTTVDTAALTGESLPRDLAEGDPVRSGCINLTGVIRLRATKTYGESTVSQIIRLVSEADSRKSRSESFITRFARVYTPIVVVAAVLLAVVPPLLASGGFAAALPVWLYRALVFLVVSCPCALVISVPLTFFGGLGGASRHGILVKGSNYMDVLAKVDTVVFDKTGTLTRGEFAVEAVHPSECDERELLHLAAHAERFSSHPIGVALRDAFPDEATDGCHIDKVEELAGRGIRCQVGGRTVCVGNTRLMDEVGAAWHDCHRVGTIVHVAIDGRYAGHIVVNDVVKADSACAVARLRRLGVERTVMLSGDRREVVADVAARLGIDEWHAALLPADKVAHVERLLTCGGRPRCVAFVGDGLNDTPVLSRASVGIAMGGLGNDAAIQAADVVLMDDEPSKIPLAIALARRTIAIARENVWFAIGVKVAVLLLAVVGLGNMMLAVFADVGVTVLAVFNAMRALGTGGVAKQYAKSCEKA